MERGSHVGATSLLLRGVEIRGRDHSRSRSSNLRSRSDISGQRHAARKTNPRLARRCHRHRVTRRTLDLNDGRLRLRLHLRDWKNGRRDRLRSRGWCSNRRSDWSLNLRHLLSLWLKLIWVLRRELTTAATLRRSAVTTTTLRRRSISASTWRSSTTVIRRWSAITARNDRCRRRRTTARFLFTAATTTAHEHDDEKQNDDDAARDRQNQK